ncbi:hypothetical protein C4D60_Mb06t20960 [Musa balbisiana]|uniref:Uncharacterized protein n=1 Tax=Musa balbisiana TaxID=52838 RepID=A0A4S8IQ97_MUSBA|nr:hypothetical protein C4D60_Mb06t20960 [Musa balbisiana]
MVKQKGQQADFKDPEDKTTDGCMHACVLTFPGQMKMHATMIGSTPAVDFSALQVERSGERRVLRATRSLVLRDPLKHVNVVHLLPCVPCDGRRRLLKRMPSSRRQRTASFNSRRLCLLSRESRMGPLVLASQLAAGLGVLAGAAIVKSAMESGPMAGGLPRCATCNGTGRVACLCSRWSDGDVGCPSCVGSGMMLCRNCGGSGSGRPLPIQVPMRSTRSP